MSPLTDTWANSERRFFSLLALPLRASFWRSNFSYIVIPDRAFVFAIKLNRATNSPKLIHFVATHACCKFLAEIKKFIFGIFCYQVEIGIF